VFEEISDPITLQCEGRSREIDIARNASTHPALTCGSITKARAMEKPKHRPSPDAKFDRGRAARKSSEIQPVKQDEEIVLETYEQSPERPGGDERSHFATPDGPVPDRERATPD
jgi:hypothetical protein